VATTVHEVFTMPRLILALALTLALAACGAAPQAPRFGAGAATPAAAAPPPAATPVAVLATLPQGVPADLLAQAVGVPFELPLGEAIAVGDSGISVRLTAVAEDSRCPEDARCIWPGRAVVTVEVAVPGVEAQALTLAIPGDLTPDAPALQPLGPFTLRLVDLSPYPGAPGAAGAPAPHYVATLVVERP
jgi:hypothetical protein